VSLRFVSSGFVFVACLSVLSAVEGCSNQAIGQVCNVENGNADCEDGLVCRSKTELLGAADICCPSTITDNPACIPGGLTGGAATGTGTGGEGGTGGSTGSTVSSSTASGTGGTGGVM